MGVNTEDRARFQRIFEACCSTFRDAHLPPKLPGMIKAAGLVVEEVRTVPMVASGTTDSTPGSSWIGNWAFNVVPEKCRNFGLAPSDVGGWLREQTKLSEEGAFFACVHRFVFSARKR